jgi:hypothetical protein
MFKGSGGCLHERASNEQTEEISARNPIRIPRALAQHHALVAVRTTSELSIVSDVLSVVHPTATSRERWYEPVVRSKCGALERLRAAEKRSAVSRIRSSRSNTKPSFSKRFEVALRAY